MSVPVSRRQTIIDMGTSVAVTVPADGLDEIGVDLDQLLEEGGEVPVYVDPDEEELRVDLSTLR